MPNHVVQPPEWIDSAPVRVEETIEIDAPPVEVWRHLVDHVRWPEWFTPLDRVDITGMPTGVDGRRRVTARRMPIDEVFTAWDENEHFAFAASSSRLVFLTTLAESIRLEPTDTGCRVVYRQGLQGRRGFGFVIEQVGKQMAAGLEEGLAGLKARCES
jgi:uncharacterized protein YndB with AHSA1/START domain